MGTPEDVFQFKGLEPFDDTSRALVVQRTADILASLQANLNAPVEMPPPGVDVEVPEINWLVVEDEIMSSLEAVPIEDLIRMLAYWSGKWNVVGQAQIAMDRATGRGFPVETYTLLAQCCANAIIRRTTRS